MVHALYEAHRVLKPGGILIDLRPAPAHRQIGIGQGRSWQLVGALHEVLDDDYAADAAVDRVVREGLFRPDKRMQFRLDRVMDSAEEVRDFIDEFDQRRDLPPHTSLLKRLERQYGRLPKPSKIAVRGPMHLAVLTKLIRVSTEPQNGGPMILAILPDPTKAESLLNNLSEADFDLKDVSVIMKDTALRNKIAPDAGPMQGVMAPQLSSALHSAGVAQNQVQRCEDAIARGQAVVVMKVDPKYEAAARQMFEDISAQILKA
jgi:hypothetical protein